MNQKPNSTKNSNNKNKSAFFISKLIQDKNN